MTAVIGREAELQAVEAFLEGDGGGAAAMAIVGEPGIGKTTLWMDAVATARARGSVVLMARPAESEARLSFAGLTDLLSAAPARAFASIPAPQREALDVALLKAPARRAPERRVLGTALLSLLRALADEKELVIAIDDLHWLDASSAAAIEFALRRVAETPIRVIVSIRAEEAHSPFLASLDRTQRVQRLELGPLSLASLHRVLAHQLHRSFPRPTLVRIATASNGNPLFALEIGRLIAGDDHGGGLELPVPDNVSSLVAARARLLPAATRDALLTAAALARPDVSLVDADALAPAEEAGLVRIRPDRRIEFVHPLFASAIYRSASTARRRKTHRALAAIVDDMEERVRHIALASEALDEFGAAKLEEAARAARMRGAPDTAAELTELALRLLSKGNTKRDELRFQLAEHLYLASDFQQARVLLEEARRQLEPGDLRSRALLLLAEIDYWRSGESAALLLAEEALAVARNPLQRARCQVAVAVFAGTVDLPKAAAAARAAVELLETRPQADPGLLASALAARVRAALFLGEGFDAGAAERALALEASGLPAAVDTRVGFRLGQWLRYVDDFGGARLRLLEAEQQAREEGDDSSLANILLNRVVVETWAGEWDEAAVLTERMSDAFAQQGVESEGIAPWRAYVDAHAGRLDAVRAVAGPRPSEPVIAAIWDRCLGLAELAAGDLAAADAHLADAMGELERVDFREPAIWRVVGDAVEAASATGALDRAERWLQQFEVRAARSRIPWSLAVSARCRGILLAAGGDLEAAAVALEHSLTAHERCPVPFERARTLLVLGQVLRRLKRRRNARMQLEEARAIFRHLGAEPWAERVEGELQRVAVRRAPDELSATELRIATLAAAGLSNPEIAAQAFVTRKTVEANLGRAYRKLGISSRAQLGRALDRDAQAIS